jgi:hypothetical protein
LKQKPTTIHLAIKLFDIASVEQNLEGRDVNEQREKNLAKNLKILAGQCLLLASKFIEVQRLYPAEIVYQVKEWSHNEFEILKAGQVEEYLLNILDFDLVFLTPAEFLDMYTECL